MITMARPEKSLKQVRNGSRKGARRPLLFARAATSPPGREASDVSDTAGDSVSVEGMPRGCMVVAMLRGNDVRSDAGESGGNRRYQTGVSNGSSLARLLS